jgi:hypothetical protein
MPVIFFTNTMIGHLHDLKQQYTPSDAKGLRLMLWAGDCKHNDMTDVKRLPNYDVYFCAGWQEDLQENINDLRPDQTICVIDVENETQMALFHYVYDNCFMHIDSDYNGNTPKLPLTDYTSLLMAQGSTRNIEGVSSLIMPYEDMYSVLEIYAPVLPPEIRPMRHWCQAVMDLSRRDELPPEMVWTSPDLNHPYYSYVKEQQRNFEQRQKERYDGWPKTEPTLREHWAKMNAKTLLARHSLYGPQGEKVIAAVTPHISRFEEFLRGHCEAVEMLNPRCLLSHHDCQNQYNIIGDDLVRLVSFRQTIIKLLMTKIPYGMTGVIGYYPDDRYPERPARFGLIMKKVPE